MIGFRLEPIQYRDHPNVDPETVIAAVEAELPTSDLASVTPAATSSRSEAIYSLIQELAMDGTVSREALLSEARQRKIVEGKSANAAKVTAEQVRQELKILQKAGLISYTTQEVSLANPNIPNGPP